MGFTTTLGCYVVAALALIGFSAFAADRSEIRLRSAVLRGPEDTAGLPRALLVPMTSLRGGGPILLKFREPVGERTHEALAAAGARLAAYVGNDAFIAWVPPGGLQPIQRLQGIDWVAPYHPGLRIAPGLAAIAAEDPDARIAITLHLFPHADVGSVRQQLESRGLDVRSTAPGRPSQRGPSRRPGRIVLVLSHEQWTRARSDLARMPEIFWIDRRPAYRLLNDTAAWVGQSGLDAGAVTPVFDNGLFGDGQVIGVLDSGVDADSCFFRDDLLGLPATQVGLGVGAPDPAHRKVLIVDFLWNLENPLDPLDWDTHGHGSHVAGSVAGDDATTPGERDPGDGMAPAAKLVIQDGGYGVDDCADMPALGCPVADLYPYFEQAYLQGARIHSNAYGDRENLTPQNIYSDGSEAADAFMWDHPDVLLVFAAGNQGPAVDTVGSPATAKNVLAVGSTRAGPAAGEMSIISSRGLTHDGRLKPDVTAPGAGVISADTDGDVQTDNCDTLVRTGTSQACAVTAGLAALVREYYDKGYHPTGAAVPADVIAPSAALLKASLIASAAPMETEAVPPPSGPQGWGRVLLDDVLYFPGDVRRLWLSDVAGGFTSPADPPDVYVLELLDGNEPLRVVLAWTDYPSNSAAAVNLVNDLDLEVVSPSAQLYLGNDFSGGVSTTGGSADRLNNVEAVRIDNPEPGIWTLRVRPHAVPQPTQGYALVATGRSPAAGIALEQESLVIDDTVGGNGNGILESGEWVDLPLTLLNSGDTAATGVSVQLESLTPDVEVILASAPLPDAAAGAQTATSTPHLRIRIGAGFPCTDELTLRFTYQASGYSYDDELILPTGEKIPLIQEDFEGATGWQHVASESTALAGDWFVGDPQGTDFQPAEDATPYPGSKCLYTAPNPTGDESFNDVDEGVVVARSGSYDLSGHPEARVSIHRWYGNRDIGEQASDFFRLDIREDSALPDVQLERLGTNRSEPFWTEVTFRVADYVTPGPLVELKASASDGTARENIIEAAIDEILFWDLICEVYNPAPNPVSDLATALAGADVGLSWSRPSFDLDHGEADRYGIYRSTTADGGFALLDEIQDESTAVSFTDFGAAAGPPLLFYQIIAGNDTGDAEPLP